ncbi:MAG: threonine/serine dehydratase [Candidatus Heimdallarchaeota archaeon]|nr:MAG: threonine/serine dehydratase [Candidatus Heimdallarchaeota archaeon]
MAEEIKLAYERIKNYVNKTPIMTSRTLNRMIGAKLFFKCENFQRGGAFKCRGAFNSLLQLDSEIKERGIIAHSSGNHAQAVALASRELGCKATIVMPKNAPQIKKGATREYGATIVECGNNPADRQEMTDSLIEQNGFFLIHPYNYLPTIYGAGTAAYELINEIDNLDIVLAPIGGGGLISGTSIAIKGFSPKTKVIGVEPKNADDAFRSVTDNKLYPSINPNTIADGLRTSLGEITFKIIKSNVTEIITVSELQILKSMRFIWERMKLVVEPSGAVPLAGIFEMRKDDSDYLEGKRIGIILSGGNIDITDFFTLLEKEIKMNSPNN